MVTSESNVYICMRNNRLKVSAELCWATSLIPLVFHWWNASHWRGLDYFRWPQAELGCILLVHWYDWYQQNIIYSIGEMHLITGTYIISVGYSRPLVHWPHDWYQWNISYWGLSNTHKQTPMEWKLKERRLHCISRTKNIVHTLYLACVWARTL